MSADQLPPAERPSLGSLALFQGTVNHQGPKPGRVRSTFRLNPGEERPAIRLVASEPEPFAAVAAAVLPDSMTQPLATGPVDWKLVAAFRGQVAEALTTRLGEATSKPAQEELGRAVITELVDTTAAEAVTAGRSTWSRSEQAALEQAVFNAVFRLGRLQPLVDDERVENIIILGHGRVWLQLLDGTLEPGPAVADTDEELVEFVSFLASREGSARAFSEAHPSVDLRLPGGSRMSATNWVTSTPSIVIRLHRLVEVTLDDMVQLGTLTPVMASFLAAAVRARLSIVIAGAQGAGKTTLLRALCHQIGPLEQLSTFEDPAELFLDELRERHPVVHAWEARHGSGEVGPDGRPAGEYTLEQAMRANYRKNAGRLIVGEVRGPEAWLMLEAMESGLGSLSTTHAASAEATMPKLINCCMKAGPQVSVDLAGRALGHALDLIVHIDLEEGAIADGSPGRQRKVTEIVAVTEGEKERGYALNQVFKPAQGCPAVPASLPDYLRRLARYGFDLDTFRAQASGADR